MHTAARGCRRFGSFEVDLDAGELRKRGRAIRLQEKPLRILAALLERPGEMLSRQELQDRLWADQTFVDFDHGLNNAVNKLRTALGDSAGAPRYIETVGRRGYRFIGSLLEEAAPHSEARPELLLGVSEADGGVSEHAAVVDHLPLPGSAASLRSTFPPPTRTNPAVLLVQPTEGCFQPARLRALPPPRVGSPRHRCAEVGGLGTGSRQVRLQRLSMRPAEFAASPVTALSQSVRQPRPDFMAYAVTDSSRPSSRNSHP